ncbi:MAG: hypothetical protein O7H39_08045 [Gammaproteobacteria bacterium]|nr:hypothetical protein [Gammaproteobacteria bacterium]
MTWDDGKPVGLDLYYDPIVDEHVGSARIGLIAPTWYFAPQQREVARAGWHTTALLGGVPGDGPITGLDDPARATMLLQFAGEFADPATKQRIWAAAEEHIEPKWDRDLGEFTLGFGLDEPHPRGQWNARAMAGWVCTEGAWSRIFNEPNLTKFDEPTVEGVDFPRVALSEAKWDGSALRLAAHPQNAANQGISTTVRITHVGSTDDWVMTRSNGETVALSGDGDHLNVELVVDNRVVVIRRSGTTG